MHNFKYFFREGAGNMLSHGFMSFAAVGVTVACLLIMGTFSLVAYNANINLQDLQKVIDDRVAAQNNSLKLEFDTASADLKTTKKRVGAARGIEA